MIAIAVIAVGVGACSGGAAPVTGIAGDGRALFERTVLGDNAGCVTCHSREPEVVLVGPSLGQVGADAATRVPGVDARTYLRRSIIEPDSYVVEGFDAGRMPQDWAEQLTDAEIDAIVAYLLTLGVE